MYSPADVRNLEAQYPWRTELAWCAQLADLHLRAVVAFKRYQENPQLAEELLGARTNIKFNRVARLRDAHAECRIQLGLGHRGRQQSNHKRNE